jgi:charged multivesicular body protein 4
MSLFQKIFGKNSKEKPPTPQEAIQRIREVEELLAKKSDFLEKKIDQELDTARKHGTKNKRCKKRADTFF